LRIEKLLLIEIEKTDWLILVNHELRYRIKR